MRGKRHLRSNRAGRLRWQIILFFVVSLAIASSALGAGAGGITQLASPNDCITSNGAGCGTTGAAGMTVAEGIAMSPDGKNVYVAADGSNAIAEFSRNTETGALTQLASPNNCITSNGSGCGTTGATGLTNADAVAVSADGKSVYVAAFGSNSVAEFSRNTETGALTQLASPNDCVTANASGCGTVNRTGISAAFGVTVSGDGKNVYVAGFNSNAIAEFSRNTETGALTQLASPNDCVTSNSFGCGTVNRTGLTNPISIITSPDGSNLYAASGGSTAIGAVAEFSRNGSTGALTQLASPNDCITAESSGCGSINALGMGGPESLAISPDGQYVYVAAFQSKAIAALGRNASTGALSQLAPPNDCITFSAIGCSVTNAPGLNVVQGVAISADGRSLYATGAKSNSLAEFSRNTDSGAITQLASPENCITQNSSGCGTVNAHGLAEARRVVLSPDGSSAYVVSTGSSAIAEFSRQPVPPPGGGGGGGGNGPTAGKLTLGKLKLNKKKGTAKLTATVNEAGSLKLSGKGLKAVAKQASGAGNVILQVKPKGKTKKTLAKKGKTKVKIIVTFTPTGGGASASQSKSGKLKFQR